MTNNFPGGRTKIKWRGDMLVAWFAEATPPVLWRWQASDISSGFGLKKEDGRTELVKHEAATGSTVVAAFANEARAQTALGELSSAMMEGGAGNFSGYGQARSWPGTVWKWLSRIVLTLLLLYFTYGMSRIMTFLNDPIGNVTDQLNAARAQSPDAVPQFAPQQGQLQAPGQQPARSPVAAPAAPANGQGKPVDADALFH